MSGRSHGQLVGGRQRWACDPKTRVLALILLVKRRKPHVHISKSPKYPKKPIRTLEV